MLSQLLAYVRQDLALDLGSSNTRIAIAREGLVLDEPSIVAVDTTRREVLSNGQAVGQVARQLIGRTPDSVTVIAPLCEGAVAEVELCEAMLRRFLGKIRRWPTLRPRVVAAVPGQLSSVGRRALVHALQRSGAGSVILLPKAKAAALGAALPLAEPVGNLICDVGGGTTEIALLSLGDSVAGRTLRLGGQQMDEAVVAFLRRSYSLRIGLPAAERLRIELGSAAELDEERVDEVTGLDAVSGLPRKASVTSEEIRFALYEPLERILDALRAVLDQANPELAADLLQTGIVLCGAAAQLPGLDRYLREHTGLPVRLAVEPALAVLRGTQIVAEDLPRWLSGLERVA